MLAPPDLGQAAFELRDERDQTRRRIQCGAPIARSPSCAAGDEDCAGLDLRVCSCLRCRSCLSRKLLRSAPDIRGCLIEVVDRNNADRAISRLNDL